MKEIEIAPGITVRVADDSVDAPKTLGELKGMAGLDLSALFKPFEFRYEQYRTELNKSLRLMFSGVALDFSEMQRSICERLSLGAGDLLKKMEEAVDGMEPNAERMGMLGWTIPKWAPLQFARQVVEEVQSSDLDEYFLSEYDANDCEQEKALLSDILPHTQLAHWKPLLEQTIRAYERHDYLIAVPSLLLVFEGAVAKAANCFTSSDSTGVRKLVKRRRESETDIFTRLAWSSVHGFTDIVFARHEFYENPPEVLNRNWILHGRDVPRWTRLDCLRVFQALDTLVVLAWRRKSGKAK